MRDFNLKPKSLFVVRILLYTHKHRWKAFFLLNHPTAKHRAVKMRRKFYTVITLNRAFLIVSHGSLGGREMVTEKVAKMRQFNLSCGRDADVEDGE